MYVNQKLKIFFYLGLFFLGIQVNLQALRIELINTITDIAASNKIALRFYLKEADYAVYKDFLHFSTDTPALGIKNWKSSVAAFLEYAAPFKQNKLVYTESFRVDLSFSFQPYGVENDERLMSLKQAHVFVSGTVLGKNKINRSFCTVVSLASLKEVRKEAKNFANNNVPESESGNDYVVHKVRDEASEFFLTQQNQKTGEQKTGEEEEFFWPDQFLPVVQIFALKFVRFLEMPFFVKFYITILFLLLLLVSRRFFVFMCVKNYVKNSFLLELERFLLFLFIGAHCNFLRFFIEPAYVLGGFAVFCFVLSFYYLKPLVQATSFLNMIRMVIGICLLISVVPLLVKAGIMKLALLL